MGLGVLLALVTSASWALGNILTQRLGRLVGTPRAMLWSMAAGALLAVPFAISLDARSAPLTMSVALWAVAAAAFGLMAYAGLFFAFAHEGLSVAVPIVSSWPLVAGIIAVAFLGESVGGYKVVGAAAVLVGVGLVSLPKPDAAEATSRRPLVAAAASSIGFGVMVPAMGRIEPVTGAFGATTLVFAIAIAMSASVAIVFGRSGRAILRPPPASAWLLVLATGTAETVGFVAIALARRFAPITVVAPVASLSSILTVIYAWLVLKERPRPLAMMGSLLAGGGVVVLAM